MERFDMIKANLKKRRMTDYPGQNVEMIVSDYLSDWKELDSATMYDHNLTMNMLTTILDAGGNGNENFKFPLRLIKLKLEEQLLKVRHLSYNDARTKMAEAKLDVQSILKTAKDQYRIAYDNNRWPAALDAKDSKAIRRNYGSVNALVQTGPKNSGCHNCGSKDHWVANCPLPLKKKKFPGRSTNLGKKSNTRRSHGGSPALSTPPKRGESEIKFFENKKRYWCSKCNRWTISHTTGNHKSTEELQAERKPKASMAKLDFNLHPSAFRVVDPHYSGWNQQEKRDERHGPELGLIMFGLLTAFVLTLHRDKATLLLEWAIAWITENWLWLTTSLSSGLISAVTMWWLMNLAKVDADPDHYQSYRARTGVNVIKQINQKSKPSAQRAHKGRPLTIESIEEQ
jgi:hypothetical protein